MGSKSRNLKTAVGALGAMLAWAAQAHGTSSGLNNIPTADTPADREVVFQFFTNQGPGDDGYFGGMKMGLRPWGQRLEWGVDGRMGEGDEGPLVFQAKYAVQPWENLPTFALGVANLAVTEHGRDRTGEPFKFLVLTHDFELFRAHAGYGWQQDNNAAFFGLDKTIKLFDRDLMLRSDIIQIQDEEQWLGSLGFLYMLHKNLAIESWGSEPLEDGDTIWTIKLDLIFKF
jgi:hypothetical protein